MKKNVFVLTLLCVVMSCTSNINESQRTYEGMGDKVFSCELYPVDAFKNTLSAVQMSKGGRVIGYILNIAYPSSEQKDLEAFFSSRITDAELNTKLDQLKAQLTEWGYETLYYGSINPTLRIMYGTVSGPAKVYSNQEVDGRPAGADLSDMFLVQTYGHVGYPNLELMGNKEWTGYPIETSMESFADYFKEGYIPSALDYDIYVIPEPNRDFPGTLFFEIPVTGLSKNGQETTVLFTGAVSNE